MIVTIIIIFILFAAIFMGGIMFLGGGYWLYKNRSTKSNNEKGSEPETNQGSAPVIDQGSVPVTNQGSTSGTNQGSVPDNNLIDNLTNNYPDYKPYTEAEDSLYDLPEDSLSSLPEDSLYGLPEDSLYIAPEYISSEYDDYLQPEDFPLVTDEIESTEVNIPANCPDGYEKTDGPGGLFCYKSCPPDWKGSSTPHLCQHNTISSTVGSDTNKSIPKGCEDGYVDHVGLCYKLPDNDWEVTSPGFIGKKCPTQIAGQEIKDSKTTCFYDRGVGKPYKLSCPPGQIQRKL